MENRKIIQVEEKVPPKLLIPLSIQHMFATVSYTHLDVYKRQDDVGTGIVFEIKKIK